MREISVYNESEKRKGVSREGIWKEGKSKMHTLSPCLSLGRLISGCSRKIPEAASARTDFSLSGIGAWKK